MNTRLKQLHNNKLITTVTELEDDVQALKGASQLTGGSSVVYTVSTNTTAYDWTGTVDATTKKKNFVITVTGASGTVLYANLSVKLFVGSQSTEYTPADAVSETFAEDTGASTTPPFIMQVSTVPAPSGSGPNVSQAQCILQGDPARTAWIKVYASALQPVSIGVTAL